MKRLLIVTSMLFCLPMLARDLSIVEIEGTDLSTNHNKKELMRAISSQYSQIHKAQKRLQSSKNIERKTIEQYQAAMDYQQVNLDQLRKTLQ